MNTKTKTSVVPVSQARAHANTPITPLAVSHRTEFAGFGKMESVHGLNSGTGARTLVL